MNYVLYKKPIQLETLEIVQYLHSLGHRNVTPLCCIERNYPFWVTELPAIETENGDRYIGLDECVKYYEKSNGETELVSKSHKFKMLYPDYRIH
jgi:hypothetical protein